jgi:hypothetical protein
MNFFFLKYSTLGASTVLIEHISTFSPPKKFYICIEYLKIETFIIICSTQLRHEYSYGVSI